MRKLFIFLILFISFGNFMSRSQMSDRYFFLDSYIGNKSEYGYYANRNVGYNIFELNFSSHVKLDGGLYWPLLAGSNFNEGAYWIGTRIIFLQEKKWHAGFRIRLLNFFHTYGCYFCESGIPYLYASGGMTFQGIHYHITFEAGFLKWTRPPYFTPVFSAGYVSSIGKKWNVWTEIRLEYCTLCERFYNTIDGNAGFSYIISKKFIVDMGLSFENHLAWHPLPLFRSGMNYIYPLFGFQWKFGDTTTAKPDETKPFFD